MNGEAPGVAPDERGFGIVEKVKDTHGVMHAFGAHLRQGVTLDELGERDGKRAEEWTMVRECLKSAGLDKEDVSFRPFQGAWRVGGRGEPPEQVLSMVYTRRGKRDGSWCLVARKVTDGGKEHDELSLFQVAGFVVVEKRGVKERVVGAGVLYAPSEDEGDASGGPTTLRFESEGKMCVVDVECMTESAIVMVAEDNDGYFLARSIASLGAKWGALHICVARALGILLK